MRHSRSGRTHPKFLRLEIISPHVFMLDGLFGSQGDLQVHIHCTGVYMYFMTGLNLRYLRVTATFWEPFLVTSMVGWGQGLSHSGATVCGAVVAAATKKLKTLRRMYFMTARSSTWLRDHTTLARH